LNVTIPSLFRNVRYTCRTSRTSLLFLSKKLVTAGGFSWDRGEQVFTLLNILVCTFSDGLNKKIPPPRQYFVTNTRFFRLKYIVMQCHAVRLCLSIYILSSLPVSSFSNKLFLLYLFISSFSIYLFLFYLHLPYLSIYLFLLYLPFPSLSISSFSI
jgi:hypothetical protein